MSFVTDKQTLEDLNLLGKYKTGSMFNLFNRVKTRGGELLLEDMFRAPLTNASAIDDRAGRIRYLQETGVALVIDRELTEMASQYLTEGRPANRLSCIFTAYKQKTQEVLYRSQQYHVHQRHIYAVQEVLLSASNLLGQLQKKGKSNAGKDQTVRDDSAGRNINPCGDLQDKLGAIINVPAIKQLKAKYPYTVGQTAECQYLFLHKYREQLEELLRVLYEFDVYISVAQVAVSKGLVYAEARDGGRDSGIGRDGKEGGDGAGRGREVKGALEARGGGKVGMAGGSLLEVENLRHPSLHDAIGNSISFSRRENVLFLTGANMAGKSTWMKTLGISFYLAHMGFPVAAARMRFMVMEGIFTSINVPDDLSQGWSHFYAEVMRVKTVASEVSSGKRLFVLFDELFKGTNVKDAYDATLVVTQKLARYRDCAFVISTHIIEVGEALMGTPNIQFGYMPTVMEGAVPRYTYNMTPGITTDRQGMIIIENEKILEMLM